MTASPLRSVLDAVGDGARSRHEIAARTGLRRDAVDAALDHLTRLGRLQATEMSSGCPGGGCGSCASGAGDQTPGCGAAGPSPRRTGPVLVQLTLTRR